MHSRKAFGNWGAYYEVLERDLDRQLARQQTPHVNKLGQWLEKEHGGLSSRVERAFKQWNIKIRDQLRTETGLRMSIDSMQQAVPVHVVEGFPEPLSSIIDELGEELFRWHIKKPMLIAAKRTLDDVKRDKSLLDQNIKADPAAETEEINATLGYLDQIISALEKADLLKRVSDIDTDFLGAYYFRIPKVLIYWMAIGFVARLLNVSPEALTVVVAAHELAHAYTHLGFDIDGKQWETDLFAASEMSIVEGLAQYYAQLVCKKLEDRYPEALEAYEKLLEKQPAPYLAQRDWASHPTEAGEVVRATMIECRNDRVTQYEDFRQRMDGHWERIKQGKPHRIRTINLEGDLPCN